MHRVLILGTMGEFVQLVQKSKSRGYYTVVCDGYAHGTARAFADESYIIPVTDCDRIAQLCKDLKIDGIITSFSDLLLECMVKIAHKADLPCYLQPDQLPYYRDKSVTKQVLQTLGLPTPAFTKLPTYLLDNKEALSQYISKLSYPLVTKPLDKYGSRGIYIVRCVEELMEYGKKAATFSSLDEILVEEYNDGYEFNMMTWVHHGKVHVISIADREKTYVSPNEIPISTRNVYPSCLYDQVEQSATQLLQNYIEHTGQTEGALSMQFFWTPKKGIQVCEIAARFFGYEHELTDMVYNFNIEDFLLHYLYEPELLEEQLSKHAATLPHCTGAVLYFHGKSLTIGDLTVARQFSNHPAVVKPWIFYQEGEPVVMHGPNPYVALYYIQEPTRTLLNETTNQFFQQMEIPSTTGENVLYQNKIGL